MNADIVSKAKDLAYRAHEGQVDKAGRPYIEHVARVAAAVSDDPMAEAVAWLHDVLEDAPALFAEMMQFPAQVAWAVFRVTRTAETTTSEYYQQIRGMPLAIRVKLADISDNSDESRLALLDEKTAARLRRKYAKARQALQGDV